MLDNTVHHVTNPSDRKAASGNAGQTVATGHGGGQGQTSSSQGHGNGPLAGTHGGSTNDPATDPSNVPQPIPKAK